MLRRFTANNLPCERLRGVSEQLVCIPLEGKKQFERYEIGIKRCAMQCKVQHVDLHMKVTQSAQIQ